MGLSGVPFLTCDACGPLETLGHLTPELWIRWSQWVMFISHTMIHGIPRPRVPWTFCDRAVYYFRKYAKLRYRLLPYIYSHSYKSTKTGLPMLRSMVLEFPYDHKTYSMQDQYTFVAAFLVDLVYTPSHERRV